MTTTETVEASEGMTDPETPKDEGLAAGEHEQALAAAELEEAEAELVEREPGKAVVRFGDRDRELVKTTVMPGATDDELSLFEKVCIRSQLDPFARQIYAVKRRVKQDGQWVEKWVFQTSIDGFRLVAQRSGGYGGQTPPEWCGQNAKWTDVWLSADNPAAARVGVYRHGFAEALVRTVTWREFAPDDLSKAPMWRRMGAFMLAKCAESQALRAAFPQELSGLYTAEEMEQATEDADWQGGNGSGGYRRIEGPPPADPPTSWAEIGALAEEYTEGLGWKFWTEQASVAMFGKLPDRLAPEDRRGPLFQATARAIHALVNSHAPGDFPGPTREEVQKVWADALLKVVGEDGYTGQALESETLLGPPWSMDPDEAAIGVPTRNGYLAAEERKAAEEGRVESDAKPEPEPAGATESDSPEPTGENLD